MGGRVISKLVFLARGFIEQDTHHRLSGDPRQRGVSGAVWGTVCCRGIFYTAMGGNERQLYYSDWKYQVFLVVCSEKVSCENACRKGSSNSSPPLRNLAHAHLSLF